MCRRSEIGGSFRVRRSRSIARYAPIRPDCRDQRPDAGGVRFIVVPWRGSAVPAAALATTSIPATRTTTPTTPVSTVATAPDPSRKDTTASAGRRSPKWLEQARRLDALNARGLCLP